MIDLRSDTVTIPDDGMRQAMSRAEVGDDVFGEDPTVNLLQSKTAELLGKEAALFVPSGQMGNQLAIRSHTSPGDEVIVAENAHIIHYESAAAAALSGVQLSPVGCPAGYPTVQSFEGKFRGGYYWEPRPTLVALENTINRASGAIFPQSEIEKIEAATRDHQLNLHLDGARLWNASVASGISLADLARPFDSVTVCLSKGLGAPVGSVLAGSKEFVQTAHRYRKMFGAGMRQVGFLAAAGLYAIDNNVERLKEDHENAGRLARTIEGLPGVEIDLDSVQTNIVIFRTTGTDVDELLRNLQQRNILMIKFGPDLIRATTHLGISPSDMDSVIDNLTDLLHRQGVTST